MKSKMISVFSLALLCSSSAFGMLNRVLPVTVRPSTTLAGARQFQQPVMNRHITDSVREKHWDKHNKKSKKYNGSKVLKDLDAAARSLKIKEGCLKDILDYYQQASRDIKEIREVIQPGKRYNYYDEIKLIRGLSGNRHGLKAMKYEAYLTQDTTSKFLHSMTP